MLQEKKRNFFFTEAYGIVPHPPKRWVMSIKNRLKGNILGDGICLKVVSAYLVGEAQKFSSEHNIHRCYLE